MTTNTVKKEQLNLFYSAYCPFCHRVLDAMHEMGLIADLKSPSISGISLTDTNQDSAAKKEQQTATGRTTVPCLRIDNNGKVEWLYESADIIHYLKNLS